MYIQEEKVGTDPDHQGLTYVGMPVQLSQPLWFQRHNRRRNPLRHREIARVDDAQGAAAARHFPFVGGRDAVHEGAIALQHAVGVRHCRVDNCTISDKGVDCGQIVEQGGVNAKVPGKDVTWGVYKPIAELKGYSGLILAWSGERVVGPLSIPKGIEIA